MSLEIVLIVQVQSLLEDIKDVRWDKVEKGLKTLAGRTHAVKVIIFLLSSMPLDNGTVVFMLDTS